MISEVRSKIHVIPLFEIGSRQLLATIENLYTNQNRNQIG